MKKFLVFICFILIFNTKAIGKETTYSKELFDKALSEGKVVVVSSWIKYCTSCASPMKVLKKAKNDFDNIEYFAFNVNKKEIAKFFNVNIKLHFLFFKIIKKFTEYWRDPKEIIYDA
jgi:Thioredoxin.